MPSNTSAPSELVVLLDNPFIVASLIVFIITLTVLIAGLCAVRRKRRARRNLDRITLPPPPDVYMVDPRRSLSIRNVVLSPLESPAPPRIPSSVLCFSLRAWGRKFPAGFALILGDNEDAPGVTDTWHRLRSPESIVRRNNDYNFKPAKKGCCDMSGVDPSLLRANS
ncbi:hypothetical protein K438DRAFT_1768597 [Mycena galopus ATCC 62051]|nr:hypothetical protein K438DRAFT_1768597 [Mycena galopus ATCC 62051]